MADKLTLEDFINKAKNKYQNRKMSIDIEVDDFGPITFNRPSDSDFLEYINELAKSVRADKQGNIHDTDLTIIAEASNVLVYKTCPYLHNKDLQTALEVFDPLETPSKLFGVTNVIDIAEKISDAFESAQITDKVKN